MLRTAKDFVVRRHPVAALVAMLATGTAAPVETPFALLALVPIYGIAANGSWRRSAAAVVALGGAVLAHALLFGPAASGPRMSLTISSMAIGAAAAAAGVAAGERRRSRERERTLLAEQAVTDERLRIARELHDAVGHDVTLMIVQAQALGATAGDDAVREATDAIAALGRRTMGEMSRTLHLLRNDGAEHHPQQGIAALDEVLDGARDAGVAVTVAIEGSPRPLAPALDASAFRIVQEAVTNVVRHAGGAPASVTLRYGPEELELVIADEGGADTTATAATAPAGGGHGLIGMRERVALFGGTLQAGPRSAGTGGYEVRALLPYDGSAEGSR
jgi:signal transduction histidine kinase